MSLFAMKMTFFHRTELVCYEGRFSFTDMVIFVMKN